MKKLLAMYICVSALFYGFNANASNFDMPPLDNSHTQFSLVPESLFDNSSSYQIARTYFMPDYQRNLVGRISDNGKDVNNRDCAKYGFVAACGAGEEGTVVHPIIGLTCYKDCKASCSSLGYVDKCSSTQTGTAVTTEDGLTCYKDCKCPITYRYTTSSDLTPKMLGRTAFVNHCASPALVAGESCSQTYVNTDTTQTGTAVLYKECNCPSEYNSATVQADGDCTPCTNGNGVTQYACVANCRNYPLRACPSGGICTPCPVDGSQLKLSHCDKENGWLDSADNLTCPKKDCPAGYTAGVTECSDSQKYTYSSNGKSGGKVCGKCTAKKSNYVKIAVNAPTDNLKLNFTLEGSGYIIDWGDGTRDSNSSHTYAKAGDYDVTMSEGITTLIAEASKVNITKLYTLDMDTIKKANFARNCDGIITPIPNFPPSLVDGSRMFVGCRGLKGSIPKLPTSLKNGIEMFYQCGGLTGDIPELPASLINGSDMFGWCMGLTGNIPELPSNLTDSSGMFFYCTGLTGNIPPLPSSLTDCNNMFFECKGLTGNIPKLPSGLTDGSSMFSGCRGLTGSIPELPSSLTDGLNMFSGCGGLTGNIPELPSNLIDGTGMFYGCSGLTGDIPELPASLINGSGMFDWCIGLTGNIPELPSNLTDGSNMFEGCEGLTGNIPELPSSLTTAYNMFSYCTGLTGSIPELPSGLTNGAYMFQDCTGLTGSIPELPSGLTNGYYMFKGCTGLTGNIPELPSGLTDGSSMFSFCTGLTGTAPARPAYLEKCTNIFQNTNITITPEWQSCK